MSESKHTPGEWHVFSRSWQPTLVLAASDAEPAGELICTMHDSLQMPGDARLVAAAPALLEACKAFIHAIECPEMTDPSHRDYKNPLILAVNRDLAVKLARAAVAKAERGER